MQVNNQLSLGRRRDPPPKVWMPILIDCTFDKESELTPLESAMLVLDFIREEFSVADKTMEAVQKMVKEAVRSFSFLTNYVVQFLYWKGLVWMTVGAASCVGFPCYLSTPTCSAVGVVWGLALSCSPWLLQSCFPLQAVVVCIRNKEFEKASDIVKKHMGKEPRNQVSPCWVEVGAAAVPTGGLMCPGRFGVGRPKWKQSFWSP